MSMNATYVHPHLPLSFQEFQSELHSTRDTCYGRSMCSFCGFQSVRRRLVLCEVPKFSSSTRGCRSNFSDRDGQPRLAYCFGEDLHESRLKSIFGCGCKLPNRGRNILHPPWPNDAKPAVGNSVLFSRLWHQSI